MQINLQWDSSVASAPAGFQAAVQYAASLFDTTFINNITLTIDVGWNEINGAALGAGALGQSLQSGASTYDFPQVQAALQQYGLASTVLADPSGAGTFFTGSADAQALGLPNATSPSGIDGWIGFTNLVPFPDASNNPTSWDFNPQSPTASIGADTYEFIPVAEHELSEVMGRVDRLGQNGLYSPLDIFRYSNGVFNPNPGGVGSSVGFSVNGGGLVWGQFNNDLAAGDFADWVANGPVPKGVFDPFSHIYLGQTYALSTDDLRVMNALGWTSLPAGTIGSGVAGYVKPGLTNDISFVNTVTGVDETLGTTVLTGGYLAVIGGPGGGAPTALADFTSLSGGTMEVDSGAIASRTMEFSGSFLVFTGGIVSSSTISGGSFLVAGSSVKDLVTGPGIQTVLSAGVAISTTLSNGGQQLLASGGSAAFATIDRNSWQQVSRGGIANSSLISGGLVTVSGQGSAAFTVISDGGRLDVLAGGWASGTEISSGGSETVSGTEKALKLHDGASLTVAVGGVVSALEIADGTFVVPSGGGEIAGIVVDLGARLTVLPGLLVSGAYVHGGTMTVAEGASATGTVIAAGGQEYVYGQEAGAQVINGGTLAVEICGTVTAADVHGLLAIGSGGTGSASLVEADGLEQVAGTETSGVISGQLVLQAPGTAFGLNVASGGRLSVAAGAEAIATHVASSGTEHISGIDLNAVTAIGGEQVIEAGGVASSARVAGDQMVSALASAVSTTLLGGSMEVSGTASFTTVSAGGMVVLSGGVVTDATLLGGLIQVSSGGTASGTVIHDFGEGHVEGGTDLATILRNAYQQVDLGLASGTVISTGGQQSVFGGVAVGVVVSSGGLQQANGGGVSGTLVLSSGRQSVDGYSSATGTILNGGTQQVDGTADQTTIDVDGLQTVNKKGVALRATVAGGQQDIALGGQAVSASILSGGLSVVSGAASFMVVSSGGAEDLFGTDSGTQVLAGGLQTLEAGAVASATRVSGSIVIDTSQPPGPGGQLTSRRIDGRQVILAGGSAVSAAIAGGTQFDFGAALSTVISSGGSALVYGQDTGAQVLAGGQQTIQSGGVASGGTIVGTGLFAVPGGGGLGNLFGPAAGAQLVAAGGAVSSTTLSGGSQTVSGTALLDRIASGGVEHVYGQDMGATISQGGVQYVESGGSASQVRLIDPGGSASPVPGLPQPGLPLPGGGATAMARQVVSQGGVALYTMLSGGRQDVFGTASGTDVRSGGAATVESGGLAHEVTISAGGTLMVMSGGILAGTITDDGLVQYAAPAPGAGFAGQFGGTGTLEIDHGTLLLSGGDAFAGLISLNAGTLELASGGAAGSGAIGFTRAGGELVISGLAMPQAVLSGFAGGDSIDLAQVGYDPSGTAALGAGNLLVVSEDSGFVALHLDASQIFAGQRFVLGADSGSGTLVSVVTTPLTSAVTIPSQNTATGLEIGSGGSVAVSSGGSVVDSIVNDGGVQTLQQGGSASGSMINDPGLEVVASGAVSIGAVISGGTQSVLGTAISATVQSGTDGGQMFTGMQVVSSGGVVSGTVISAGGAVIVSSGGTALGLQLLSGGQIDLAGVAYDSGGTATLDQATDRLSVTEFGTTTVLQLSGGYVGSAFQLASSTLMGGGTAITATAAPCFARGTRISTDRGPRAVEALRVGDRLVTAGGATRPVTWIGHRRVDIARHPRPELVTPILVSAGAFAPDVPRRDLRLSPEHAVSVEGVLTPVRCLVNGATIKADPLRQVTYYHVELDRHDIVLAEGLACESYLDCGNRDGFANAAGFIALHPDFRPRSWDEDACAPLCLSGPPVDAARVMLRARAEATHRLSEDPALRLAAGGRQIAAFDRSGDVWRFAPSSRTRSVTLRSRLAYNEADGPDSFGLYPLGVKISQIVVHAGGHSRALDLAGMVQGCGWYAPEWHGTEIWRWTGGAARIDLGRTDIDRIDVHAVGAGQYWLARDRRVAGRGVSSA